MQNRRRQLSIWIGCCLVAMVFLGIGCSPKEEPRTAKSAPSQAPVSTAPAPTATTPAAEPAAPPAMPAAAPNLGVEDHEVAGVEVALLEVKRTSGDTLTIKWQYRNKTQEEKKLTKSAFSWSDPFLLSYDAYLIDPVNKKKYLLLKDAEGTPIAARHGRNQDITVGGGQNLSTWAKFPTPPSDVTRISIYIPKVAPFEDIPISQ